jgi:NADPH:quinone reductase-like Zn-dependent oxidoreductase
MPLWLWPLARLGFGIRGPRQKILGQELAGKIEAIGNEVTRFEKGDEVFASTGWKLGAYAEYLCLAERPEDGALALKPINITYEEAAAAVVGGLEALHFLRQGNIQRGQTVLINGAGGSIGTIAIQLAKFYGATVTAVDSPSKLDMLLSIGADHVIDYTQKDFTQQGETYDVIFDVVGKSPYARSVQSLTPKGHYLIAYPGLSQMLRGRWTSWRTDKTVFSGTSSYKTEDLLFLKELIEAGTIKTVIDRRYPLEQTAEAHRYVETGQKQGNVIISITQS